MATLTELSARLLTKFRNVPNVSVTDTDAWISEAAYQYGYTPSTVNQIADNETSVLLTLAQAEGARAIAFATAHYFTYTDGEETVDKSMISEQYRKLAEDLFEDYKRQKAGLNGSTFFIAKRADR